MGIPASRRVRIALSGFVMSVVSVAFVSAERGHAGVILEREQDPASPSVEDQFPPAQAPAHARLSRAGRHSPDRLDSAVRNVQQSLATGAVLEAERLLRAILKDQPDHRLAGYLSTYLATHRTTIIQGAAPETVVADARRAYDRGAYHDVIALLQEYLTAHPTVREARQVLALAQANRDQEQAAAARADLQRRLKQGKRAYHEGRSAEAITVLEPIATGQEGRHGERVEAQRYVAKARTRITQQEIDHLIEQGFAAVSRQAYDEAEQAFRAVLERDAQHRQARRALEGLQAAKMVAAKPAASAAIPSTPRPTPTPTPPVAAATPVATPKQLDQTLTQIRKWVRAGRYEEAMAKLEKLSHVYPEEPQVIVALEEAQRAREKSQQHQAETTKVRRLFEEGRRLYHRGEYQRAIEAFEQLVTWEGASQRKWTPDAQRYIAQAQRQLEAAEQRKHQAALKRAQEAVADREQQRIRAIEAAERAKAAEERRAVAATSQPPPPQEQPPDPVAGQLKAFHAQMRAVEQLTRRKQYDAALAASAPIVRGLEQLVQEHPEHPDVALALHQAQRTAKEVEEAQHLLQAQAQRQLEAAEQERKYQAALGFLQARDEAKAIELLREMILTNPKHHGAQAALKRAQEAVAKHERQMHAAAEAAKVAEAKQQQLAEAERRRQEQMAAAERQRREAEQAQQQARQEAAALQAKVNALNARVRAAQQLAKRKQYDEALAAIGPIVTEFQQLVETSPQHPELATHLQAAQQAADELKDAQHIARNRQVYDEAVRLYSQGQYTEAITQFEEVIRLEGNPDYRLTPSAQDYIKKSKEKLDEEQRRAALEERYQSARAAMRDGDFAAAVQILEDVLAQDSQHRGAQRDLKLARKQLADQAREADTIAQKEAQRKQQVAARDRAEQIKALFEEGLRRYRAGEYQAAIEQLQQIAVVDPHSPYVEQAQRYVDRAERALKILAAGTTPTAPLGTIPEAETSLITFKAEVASLIQQAKDLLARGYYEAATTACQQALLKDPTNKQAQDLLNEAERRHTKEREQRFRQRISLDDQRLLEQVAEIQQVPQPRPGVLPTRGPTPLGGVESPLHGKMRLPVTVDFHDVDLGFVLNFLAEETGVNIVSSSGVSLKEKRVNIKIKDMPMNAALKYILQNQGLSYRVEPDAVVVSTKEELEREELETRVYFLTQGMGLFTKFGAPSTGGSVELGGGGSVAEVITIKDVLEKTVGGPAGSKITLDERTGALIVTNTPANLRLVEEILFNLDTTPVQVLIEARFIEVSVTDLEERGLELKLTADAALDKTNETINGVTTRGTAIKLLKDSGINFTDFSRKGEGLDLTFQGVLTGTQYENALHFLDEVVNAKTLSAPRITTLNNQTATIKVVDEFTVPTRFEVSLIQFDKNGDGDFNDAGETEFANVPQDFVTRPIGILLNVTPSVGADNRTITLTLVPEVSEFRRTVEFSGKVQIPEFTFRTLTTSVVMHDSETVVLGGLIKETDSKTTTKIPLLGDIPIVGNAFRKSTDKVVRSNLLIFVTARILTPTGSFVKSAQ